jgi:hypothetical protein
MTHGARDVCATPRGVGNQVRNRDQHAEQEKIVCQLVADA